MKMGSPLLDQRRVIELSKPLSSKSFLTILTNFKITFIGNLVQFYSDFWLSRIRLVSSILHHFDCTAHTEKVNMFWKLENEFFQFDTDHYCKFVANFVYKWLYSVQDLWLLFHELFFNPSLVQNRSVEKKCFFLVFPVIIRNEIPYFKFEMIILILK